MRCLVLAITIAAAAITAQAQSLLSFTEGWGGFQAVLQQDTTATMHVQMLVVDGATTISGPVVSLAMDVPQALRVGGLDMDRASACRVILEFLDDGRRADVVKDGDNSFSLQWGLAGVAENKRPTTKSAPDAVFASPDIAWAFKARLLDELSTGTTAQKKFVLEHISAALKATVQAMAARERKAEAVDAAQRAAQIEARDYIE